MLVHGIEHAENPRRSLVRDSHHLLRQFVKQRQEAGLAVMPRIGRQPLLVRFEAFADGRNTKIKVVFLTVECPNY